MTRAQELAQTVRECLDLGLQSWRTTRVAPRFLTACDNLDDLVALAEAGEQPVLAEITAERERQDAKWGGPDHDDIHSWHHWIDFIVEHACKAYSSNNNVESYANARRRYIEVAALAVAAVESMDRTVME